MPTTVKPLNKKEQQLKFANMISDTVLPFKEKPADNRHLSQAKGELTAQDLFSRFTADIIKENIVFKR